MFNQAQMKALKEKAQAAPMRKAPTSKQRRQRKQLEYLIKEYGEESLVTKMWAYVPGSVDFEKAKRFKEELK